MPDTPLDSTDPFLDPRLLLSFWQNWRTEVHREHELISMRTGWMLTFHSFALTAFAIFSSALINMHVGVKKGETAAWTVVAPSSSLLVAVALIVISLAGLMVAWVGGKAVEMAIERLKKLGSLGDATFRDHRENGTIKRVNAKYLEWESKTSETGVTVELVQDSLATKSLYVPRTLLKWVFVLLWVFALLSSISSAMWASKLPQRYLDLATEQSSKPGSAAER